MRVLVVEDDVPMAAAIRRGLRAEGVAADVATRGMDAFETCRRLREDGVWTPILMLTARESVEDRVRGLDEGADDYLTKPFSLAELLARLRALARRGPLERPAGLLVGGLPPHPRPPAGGG